MANLEVLADKPKLLEISGIKEGEQVVIVTVAQAEHGLDDGDVVALEDMRGDLEKYNGNDSAEVADPATYIIDSELNIVWSFVPSDYRVRADISGVIQVLKELQTRNRS